MSKERKKLIYVTEPPEGLFYIPRFVSLEEERQILRHVEAQPFEPYDHHGYKANREVVYFGSRGRYEDEGLEDETEPMPEWLEPLRDRFAHLMGLDREEIARALIARYKAGAGIGWHRDRPQFGPTVMGLSLASDAEMRFRRFVGETEEMYKANLEHGSAYFISGPSRSVWQHGMNPVKQLRYSITFRTIRDKKKDSADPRHKPANIARRLSELNVAYEMPHSTSKGPRQLRLSF